MWPSAEQGQEMKPACDIRRCPRPVRVQLVNLNEGRITLCTHHARVRADMHFASKIRRIGKCALEASGCRGNLQCCHILRRALTNIRWDERNALCMCAAHHVYYTHRPEEWRVVIEKMFPGRLDELQRLSQADGRPDMEEVLRTLA